MRHSTCPAAAPEDRRRAPASKAVAAGLTVLAVLPALAAVPSAAAGPRTTSTQTAPYRSSDAPVSQTCTTGATCAGTASADRASGRVLASGSYDRTLLTSGKESVVSAGVFQEAVRVPKGSRSATVTATWHVTSASASAVSTRGLLAAGSQLSAQVLCDGGCTSTREVRQVTLACSTEGVSTCVGAPGAGGSRAAGVDLTVTTTVHDLTSSSFLVRTDATNYVLAHPLCSGATSLDRPLPLTEDCSVTVDPDHAGSARSEIDATLVSLQVDPA